VFFEKFRNPDEAIAFEKQIKGWIRKKKEAIIENNWFKLKELSVCQNRVTTNP
jgi:putative endonuclease